MTIIKDNLTVRGEVSITVSDSTTGQIKHRRKINNLVVQSGKDLIAATFAGSSAETVTHIGFGSNTPATAASLSQTALVSPFTPRLAVTQTLNTNPATILYETVAGAGVITESIGEVGLFTASTGGTMVARTTFTAIPKGPNDILTISWTLIFG